MNKQILILAAMTAIAFHVQLIHADEAPLYLGEFCWQAQSNSLDEPESATLKLGVLSFGENHFPLSGLLSFAEGDMVLHGNAELTKNGIEASLQGTAFGGSYRETSSYHLVLDANFNGTYLGLGFEAIGGGSIEGLTDEGVLTLTPCGD